MALLKALASDDRHLQPVDAKSLSSAASGGLKRVRVIQCEGPLSRQLPGPYALVPAIVALAAVAAVSDPHNESRAGREEELKEALRSSGALEGVAGLSNRTASSLGLLRNPQQQQQQQPQRLGDEDKKGLWVLQLCMLTMEHATFCFLDNVKHLCSLRVPCPPWASSSSSSCLFAEANVRIMQRLSAAWQQHPASVQPSLRACLSRPHEPHAQQRHGSKDRLGLRPLRVDCGAPGVCVRGPRRRLGCSGIGVRERRRWRQGRRRGWEAEGRQEEARGGAGAPDDRSGGC